MRSLRNPDLVKPETRDRIRAIARELGFVPSRSASSLASGKLRRIAVLIGSPRIGMGDVKLSVVAGAFLAYQGWMPLLVGAAAGFVLGAVVGLTLLAARKARRDTTVPFGPSMLGGAVLVLASIPAGLFAL